MDEEFIRNRITELRLKKGVSEYQMSMELGQNRSYIQAISSGRSMPSMKQFLNICEYFEITPLQFFDAQENNPQLIKKALDGMRKMSDDDLINPILHKPLCVDDQKLVHNNPHQSGEPPLDELHREFQCSQQDAEIPHRLVPERDDS